MKNLLIFTFIIFLFLIGGSVFYRYVIYLPKVEQQKLDLEQKKVQKKETRDVEINNEYNQCMQEAKENFKNKMHATCSAAAEQHNEKYKKCLENGAGLLRDLCESELRGYQDPNPSSGQCGVPKSIGDNLINERKQAEAQCLSDREFKSENNR
jgi:hypothetical protein